MQGGQQTENAGIADEGVKPAPSATESFAQPIDGGEVAQIHRNQGRRLRLFRPERSNFVIQFLKATLVRASATTCAPDLAKARAAARPMPREAPVTSAIRGGILLRRAQSTLLASFARLAYGAWLREDARRRGAGSHQRRLRRCDKRGFSIPPIIGSTPQGLQGQ